MAQMQEVKVRYTFVSGAVLSAFMSVLSFSGCALESVTTEDEVAVGESKEYLFQGDPNTVFVESVVADGSGCPGDATYSTVISDDQLVFTTTFNQYSVNIDVGDRLDSKFCNLQIRLHVPNGFSIAVHRFFLAGFADILAGASGNQNAYYNYAGNSANRVNFNRNLTGPFAGNTIFENTVLTRDLVWSQCGVQRNLNVNTRISVRNNAGRTSAAFLETQTLDEDVSLQFVWNFQPC